MTDRAKSNPQTTDQHGWHLPRVVETFEQLANPAALEGMARFGITPQKSWGISLPNLRALARQIGRNHRLALELWEQNTRETRILASLIDDPRLLTSEQMEAWVKSFDYWEICDQCCQNLFEKSPLAWTKAIEWSQRPEEFTKRAGFVLMARLAVSDKKSPAECFTPFFDLIIEGASDHRPMVKKAVNWALRQIGKRGRILNQKAISVAEQLLKHDSTAARWVARDALRELQSAPIQRRLAKHA